MNFINVPQSLGLKDQYIKLLPRYINTFTIKNASILSVIIFIVFEFKWEITRLCNNNTSINTIDNSTILLLYNQ